VAEALEKDMSANLATKQDLQHLDQLTATRFEALESLMTTRFEDFESRITLMMQNQESRNVIKLGVLMTVLFGLVSAVQALLR
jgi:hypothetical protein